MKQVFISIAVAAIAQSAIAAVEPGTNPAPIAKPNILLIVSDDQSYPYLSCYGEPAMQTPNLDKLAAEGMKFHRMFVTSPQCSPSRCSLMTGRSAVASRTSRFGAPLPRAEVTFPELLRKDAGYFTGILGRHSVSISAVTQRAVPLEGGHVPVVVLTHAAREAQLDAALAEIHAAGVVGEKPKKLRMLD